MKKNLKNISPILVVFIIILIYHSPIIDEMYNNRCCDFEKENINGVIHYVTFGQPGNIFRLESDKKKNYYFLNKGRFNDKPKIFGNIAQKGQQIVKKSYSDTLFLVNGNEKIHFEIVHCCEE